VGYETGDDAAIYRIDERVALVLTTDFFAPIVDDPFDYGQIAAANALSDVYAVGGTPITALNIAAFPRDLGPDIIAKILEGGQKKAEEAGILIIGGHTIDDPKIVQLFDFFNVGGICKNIHVQSVRKNLIFEIYLKSSQCKPRLSRRTTSPILNPINLSSCNPSVQRSPFHSG